MQHSSLQRLTLSALALLSLVAASRPAFALGEKSHVAFAAMPAAFPIATPGHATPLVVDPADFPGVRHAATNLTTDIASVTGIQPTLLSSAPTHADDIILIGTLNHSALIDLLIATHKLNADAIRNRWETSITQVVDNPLPGVRRALVIVGADKRGTIFGIYDLSEQIGVSPWAWWADVPTAHHDALFLTPGTYLQPEARVRYRGIFLNDEAPALSGWAQEKFGGFNHVFYEHVFDLLLRLKANFLWPAMWGSAFNEDDPINAQTADEYGIVMGTSHHEPMMRAQQEWKRHGTGPWDYTTNASTLDAFWRAGVRRNKSYEQLTTIGMRGDGDLAMSADTNTALLESIVAEQRKILAEEVNPDVTKVPQVWALYKEVQGYYEKGMRVPDDVTLLWCDDNWGNLRRLPTAEERKRPGGAGIYYHFDYVGDPRSYRWLNTTSITKVQEQMNLAAEYGADRLWIVNVGDLKPMEFPIEFFLSMARTPERWTKDNLTEFTTLWATREFGPAHAAEIADLIATYTRFNSRRKPEQLEPTTYSLTEAHEADRIDADWRALAARAEAINTQLPTEARAAFFELVLYPIEACATVGEMYIAAGRNNLFAKQGRASANDYAEQTRTLFARDAALSAQYNHLLNGKWNHMMDQTHIGYTFWNEPPLNAMPAVQQVTPLPGAHMRIFPEIAEPTFDSANNQTRTLDIANAGTEPFHYTATTAAPWLHIDAPTGLVTTDTTLHLTIDFTALPLGESTTTLTLTHDNAIWDNKTTLTLHANKLPTTTRGFIESDNIIAIDAAHVTAAHNTNITWQQLPGFGETHSAMETFPVLAPSTPTSPQPCLDYTFTTLASGLRTVQTILAPTLPFQPAHPLRFSLGLDTHTAITVDAWPLNTAAEWATAVSNGVNRTSTPLGLVTAGEHKLHLCSIDAGIAVERLLILGNAPNTTYLGPPESAYLDRAPHS